MVQNGAVTRAEHVQWQKVTRSRRRKRRHVPHHLRPQEFVQKRNTRERRRIHGVNEAFELLRRRVPVICRDDKTPKINILRHASSYIMRLTSLLLTEDDTLEEKEGITRERNSMQGFAVRASSCNIDTRFGTNGVGKNCARGLCCDDDGSTYCCLGPHVQGGAREMQWHAWLGVLTSSQLFTAVNEDRCHPCTDSTDGTATLPNTHHHLHVNSIDSAGCGWVGLGTPCPQPHTSHSQSLMTSFHSSDTSYCSQVTSEHLYLTSPGCRPHQDCIFASLSENLITASAPQQCSPALTTSCLPATHFASTSPTVVTSSSTDTSFLSSRPEILPVSIVC